MRIADKSIYDQINSSLSKNRSDLSKLQTQASTQKRVNRPADDPLAAARVLVERTEVSGMDQYKKNADYARSFLEYADQSMGELTETLLRAKELALSQANDASSNETTRKVSATEVEQLFAQVVQIGNRKLGDRFLFGGYKTLEAPFDSKGGYRGDDGTILIQTNKDGFVHINIPGSELFHGESLASARLRNQGGSQPPGNGALGDRSPKPNGEVSPEQSEELVFRGPASSSVESPPAGFKEEEDSSQGVNLFKVLKELEAGLRTGDKRTIHESLDFLDEALEQVILSRSQLGARIMGLNNASETLDKSKINSKITQSQLEDADLFSTVNDLNKSETTLKATLATSGKMVQPSLLDFLR